MKKPALISAGSSRKQLLTQAEFSVELVNASAGIYQFLFACIKGVTLGADFYFDILLRASRFNNFSASALDSRLLVVGMDPFFHYVHLSLCVITRESDFNIRYCQMQAFF